MENSDFLTKFKNSKTYNLLISGILKGDMDKVISGEYPYFVGDISATPNTSTNFILETLNILLVEDKLSQEEINASFNLIPINEKFVCLLLDYYQQYLRIKNKVNYTLLQMDFTNIIEQIKGNISEFENQYCVRYFTQKINEESGEIIFPKILI